MERRDQWALKILKWDDPVITLSKLDSDPFRVKVRDYSN
jgi:hypothetical protein